MSIREKLKKSNPTSTTQNKLPKWVTKGNETTKLLYKLALNELEIIKNTETKNKKIIASKLTASLGLDKSVISKRLNPQLREWIIDQNTKLESDQTFVLPQNKSKPSITSLKKVISELRAEIKELKNQNTREIVEAFFASHLLDDRDKLASEVSKYKYENEQLRDKNVTLVRNNIKLIDQLSEL